MRRVTQLTVLLACGSLGAADPDLPPAAHGTFIQRKILADVDVTLVSTGEFSFVRDRSFTWTTRKPVTSVFCATPTNYSFTVAGQTTFRPLDTDVTDISQLFRIKEMREFVTSVKTDPPQGFPSRVTVNFKNGDRLEIELTRRP